MKWYLAKGFGTGELASQEIAALVDNVAMFHTTMEARELVAQLTKKTFESVTRTHQRHGTSAEQLNARRKLDQERTLRRAAWIETKRRERLGNKKD